MFKTPLTPPVASSIQLTLMTHSRTKGLNSKVLFFQILLKFCLNFTHNFFKTLKYISSKASKISTNFTCSEPKIFSIVLQTVYEFS